MTSYRDKVLTHQLANEETRGKTKFLDIPNLGIPSEAKGEAAIEYSYLGVSHLFGLLGTTIIPFQM